MITVKDGDLFSATEGIICHQVNCKGVMGRGVAKTFKQVFPENYELYKEACNNAINSTDLLGKLIFLGEDDNKYSCSMFAQDDYHNRSVCNTNYEAFRSCCKAIAHTADAISSSHKVTINMPYKIGCGLGGGDWDVVLRILWEEFGDYNVILWRLNPND